jgi:hypothetical protein
MRIGISSRGSAWLSMGPVGWLVLGPFILAGYTIGGVLWCVVALLRLVFALGVLAVHAAKAARGARPRS